MTLADLNLMDAESVYESLYKCCGSGKWCERMLQRRPFMSVSELTSYAELTFMDCEEKDWMEAFAQHPKIGDLEDLKKKFASTGAWAGDEQAGVREADEATLVALKEGNDAYLEKFGYIFIVCATGMSAYELLRTLRERLENDPETELKNAVHEQCKITKLRLEKLLD